MCGRYASTRSAADLAALFSEASELDGWSSDVEDLTDGALGPDFNLAPTDPAPIVRLSANRAGPVLCVARWGFVPPWAPDRSGAARMINARAESITDSRAYAKAFREHRCLVPADGWYEWRREGSGKQPYFMTRPDLVTFGGVWSTWANGERRITTFSIVTVPAQGPLSRVHDRMPLVLEPSRWRAWLGDGPPPSAGGQTGSDSAFLLTPPSLEYCAGIEIRPVSAGVGDVRNDGPELVRPVPVGEPPLSTVDQTPTLF